MLRLSLYSRVPTTDGIEQVPCMYFLSQQRFGEHVPGSGAITVKKTNKVLLSNRTLPTDRT